MALQTFSHIFQKQTTDRLVDVDHNDNFFFFKSLDFNWSQEHNKSNGITIWMLKSFLKNLFCVLSIYRSFFPWKFVAINSICMVSSSNLMCVWLTTHKHFIWTKEKTKQTVSQIDVFNFHSFTENLSSEKFYVTRFYANKMSIYFLSTFSYKKKYIYYLHRIQYTI